MLTPGFCRACSRALSPGSKKLMPLTVVPSTSRGLVRRPMARTPVEKWHAPRRRSCPARTGERDSAVAAEQNRAQVDQAVDGLLDRREATGRRPAAVFYRSVALGERHVVGGGLDAQHDTALGIHLDRALAEAMFDAGSLDSGGELRADLLRQSPMPQMMSSRPDDIIGRHSQLSRPVSTRAP